MAKKKPKTAAELTAILQSVEADLHEATDRREALSRELARMWSQQLVDGDGEELRARIERAQEERAALKAECDRLKAAATQLPEAIAEAEQREHEAELEAARKRIEKLRVEAAKRASEFDRAAKAMGQAFAALCELHAEGTADARALGLNAAFVLRAGLIEDVVRARMMHGTKTGPFGWPTILRASDRERSLQDLLGLQ